MKMPYSPIIKLIATTTIYVCIITGIVVNKPLGLEGFVKRKKEEQEKIKQEKIKEEKWYKEKMNKNWGVSWFGMSWWEKINAIKNTRIKVLEKNRDKYLKKEWDYWDKEMPKEEEEKEYQKGIDRYKNEVTKDSFVEELYRLLLDLEYRKYDKLSREDQEWAKKYQEWAKEDQEWARECQERAKKRLERMKEYLERMKEYQEDAKEKLEELKKLVGEEDFENVKIVRKMIADMKQWAIEKNTPIKIKELAQEIVTFEMGEQEGVMVLID